MENGICIALTGGIACGKSTVCGFWHKWGAEILDADDVAHELIAPGGSCVDAVALEFGDKVRSPDGGIDRKRLGAIVFHDEIARLRLNDLIHPSVLQHLRTWAGRIREQGRHGVAAIPLLYESRSSEGWDSVVCVAADSEVVFQRLADRGLSRPEAEARVASQWPVRQKCARADIVIENSGTLLELEGACRRVWKEIFEPQPRMEPRRI
ncbi:MAG: dephospho-CoA kinase [Verrucomicrobiota bacterium]|jgi:dephospho-CoA kinase|nr:dephospho-CoA kinase [Verrucomicrobiota bacterium]